jgi:hypothetical protein
MHGPVSEQPRILGPAIWCRRSVGRTCSLIKTVSLLSALLFSRYSGVT